MFDFLKKKQDNESGPTTIPLPPLPSGQPTGQDDELTPLPPLELAQAQSKTGNLDKQLADLQKNISPIGSPVYNQLPVPPMPQAPANKGSSEEHFDWTAPVGEDAGSMDSSTGNVAEGKEELSPSPSLADYDPYHEEKIDQPTPEDFGLMSSAADHGYENSDSGSAEQSQENFINIELPAFEGNGGEISPEVTEIPLRKIEPVKLPVQAKKPEKQENKQPKPLPIVHEDMDMDEFTDFEGNLNAMDGMQTDIDVFVNVADYSAILSAIEQGRKEVSSRNNALNRALQLQESEQAILNELHHLLEANQKSLMKIDRILFEYPS